MTYVKTEWIPNETVVSAANLNKIEGALSDLYTKVEKIPSIKMRYVKETLNGYTDAAGAPHSSNQWLEFQVFSQDINVALNKVVTSSIGPTGSSGLDVLVNGNTTERVSLGTGEQWVKIDLGQMYTDITHFKVWHIEASSGRKYNSRIEVSEDNLTWTTIYDTAVSGTYDEVDQGKQINISGELVEDKVIFYDDVVFRATDGNTEHILNHKKINGETTEVLNIKRNLGQDYTVVQIEAPTYDDSRQKEATLTLMRSKDPDTGMPEFVDFYNMNYSDTKQYGIRIQKRGEGSVFRDFVFDFDDGLTKTEAIRIKQTGAVEFPNQVIVNGTDIQHTITDNTNHIADLASQEADKGASLIGLHDINNLFTATTVEGALNELFTNVNNSKASIATAIGTPALPSDTFETLAGYLEQVRSNYYSRFGWGDQTEPLIRQSTVVVDDLKKNMSNKLSQMGVTVSYTETMNTLINRITDIPKGKKWATGTTGDISDTFNITGLSFQPSRVMYYPISGGLTAIGIATIDGDISGEGGLYKNRFAYIESLSLMGFLYSNDITFTPEGVNALKVIEGYYGRSRPYKWIAYE